MSLSHSFKEFNIDGVRTTQNLYGDNFFVTREQQQTQSNFMDYFIERHTWFKDQLKMINKLHQNQKEE